MSELIVFDKYSIEELDIYWRKKDYEKVIHFFTEKYSEFIQSIKVLNFQSLEKYNNFYSVASEIDDKRLLKYTSEVDIQENELKLYLAKYINSSKDDLVKKKFYKEFIPLKYLFEITELCHEYELDEKNSFGYLMEIVSAAGNINSDFGYYVYQNKVKQYISELSYFEKKKMEKKQRAINAGIALFGPFDILDVIDRYTSILEIENFDVDDEKAKVIYIESAEEIISWGGNDTKWIGSQLSKLCYGLLARGMYISVYELITEYYEYPVIHKHFYILEVMKNVSHSEILWDCIARMENYIKQNREAKGFDLSIKSGRDLLQSIIPEVLKLIESDILLQNMLVRYKKDSVMSEEKINEQILNFKDYLLEKNNQIEKADSKEVLDILYKLTGSFKDLFYEFVEGRNFLDALHYEYHNVRQYKKDYFFQADDIDIFQYDKLEKEVLHFKSKVIMTSVKKLREDYLTKLESATSASEYKLLRDKLINEINDSINKDFNKVIYEKIYNDKKEELISLFNGEKNWIKLDETTQDFLVSGEIVYDHLLPLGDKVDYSAAVIPLTKALENEIYIHFHREFVNYCVAKRKDVPDVVQEVTGTYFSLASLNKYVNDVDYATIAKDYLPTTFKGGYVKLPKDINGKQFVKDVNNIRKNYRNKVAHKEGISKQTAINCRENMLLIEKMLFKFINDKK